MSDDNDELRKVVLDHNPKRKPRDEKDVPRRRKINMDGGIEKRMAKVKNKSQTETIFKFNEIFEHELNRLYKKSRAEGLTATETKTLANLVESFKKLNAETREIKKEGVLANKTDEEIVELVEAALAVLGGADEV